MLRRKRHQIDRRWILAACCLVMGLVPAPVAAQGKIYFSSIGLIDQMDLDGSNLVTIYSEAAAAPWALALDLDASELYWSDLATLEILRSTLLGQNVEVLVAGVRSWGIALDPPNDLMYWNTDISDVFVSGIYRSAMDGTNPELVIPSDGRPAYAIAMDTVNRKLYWTITTGTPRLIRRANLDGSAVETVVEFFDIPAPVALALDVADDRLYWSAIDIVNGLSQPWVGRSRLDGSEVEVLYQPASPIEADGIALDVPRGHIYWTSRDSTIQRANLDGTDRVAMNLGINGLRGIAIDTRTAVKVPAASAWGIAVLMLAIVAAGTIVLRRQRCGKNAVSCVRA